MLLLESSLCIPLIAFSAADVPTIFVEKTFCSIFFSRFVGSLIKDEHLEFMRN
jgi:hypothetical protein